MNKTIKIAIADSDVKVHQLLQESIKKHKDSEITHIYRDGQTCIESLEESNPDILIMDMLLPNVTGFKVLDYIRKNKRYNDLLIIVGTALVSDKIISKIIEYDIDYIISKPYDPNELIKTAGVLYRTKLTEKSELAEGKVYHDKFYGVISKVLIDLGIKSNLAGFDYLKTAIFKAYKDIELLKAVTKELYPLIAEIYQTEPANVERSIRHAITRAWNDKANINRVIKNYGFTKIHLKRPANSELISVISHYLKINDIKI